MAKGTPHVGRPKGIPKTGGRRKGTSNKATREAKEFCASIIDDPEYQRTLRERAINATLSPAVEVMLWHYARGVPKQTVAVEGKRWPMYALTAGLVPVMSPDPE
jgi:hypothetical protein